MGKDGATGVENSDPCNKSASRIAPFPVSPYDGRILPREPGMNALEVVELIKDSLFLLMKISTPIMLVALVVGLAVALFQALTQIQEMTLTFVPKIIAIFFCLIVMLPWMIESMMTFMEHIADLIITVESRDSD